MSQTAYELVLPQKIVVSSELNTGEVISPWLLRPCPFSSQVAAFLLLLPSFSYMRKNFVLGRLHCS